MNFRTSLLRLVSLPFLAACIYACSDSNSSSAANGGPSCDDVCAAVTDTCGATPPACTSQCASFTAAKRQCITSATTCGAMNACADQATEDASAEDSGDSGTNKDAVTPPCDGTKYCSDDNTVAVCKGVTTTKTSCYAKKCSAGRCGACTSDDACKGVTYRCKCKDGTEKTGAVDSTCTDFQGSNKWCSHPSIGESICAANGGGFDPSFGYLSTGCVSSVDP